MNVVVVILEILSAVSGLAGVLTLVLALRNQPVNMLSRASLFTMALAFVGVAVMSGLAGSRKAQAGKPGPSFIEPSRVAIQKPADAQPLQPHGTTLAGTASADSDVVKPEESQTLTSARMLTARPMKQDKSVPIESRISVTDDGRALPDVAAAAEDVLLMLRPEFHLVRGQIRASQGAADVSLQGLITTDLTLDVDVLDSRGVVERRFTIRSRGGGFTSETSASQACDRLRNELRTRIDQERL